MDQTKLRHVTLEGRVDLLINKCKRRMVKRGYLAPRRIHISLKDVP